MAQLTKGKLNFRCPSCFMRDLDIDMFYNKETQCFVTEYEWGTLAFMINDDYFDIKKLDNTIPE